MGTIFNLQKFSVVEFFLTHRRHIFRCTPKLGLWQNFQLSILHSQPREMPILKPLNVELSFFLFVFRFYSPSKKFCTSLLISIQTFQCFSSHNWRKCRQMTLD